MAKRTPVKVSKETNLKIIVILLIILVILVATSHYYIGLISDVPDFAPKATSTPSAAGHSASRSTLSVSSKEEATIVPNALSNLEIPAYSERDAKFIIRNKQGRYTLLYDTTYRQAAWVAYLLTRAEVKKKGVGRKDNFRSDPEVIENGWATATTKDYANSGYDRGHLLPSADRDDTQAENSVTFYLSNISPQRPALNRQIWKLLEEHVRMWTLKYDSVYIVTGGELKSDLKRIQGGVGVPERFYKVLLTRHNGAYHSIAFLIPNLDKLEGVFGDYSMSVNELEQTLGYNFFPNLPDSIEEEIEEKVARIFAK